jgi:hypothetical protein
VKGGSGGQEIQTYISICIIPTGVKKKSVELDEGTASSLLLFALLFCLLDEFFFSYAFVSSIVHHPPTTVVPSLMNAPQCTSLLLFLFLGPSRRISLLLSRNATKPSFLPLPFIPSSPSFLACLLPNTTQKRQLNQSTPWHRYYITDHSH